MCGIAGILGTSEGFAVDEELVTTMRELILHRGPDDGGSWHSPEHRVALGAPAALDHRSEPGRAPADVATRTARSGSPSTARSTTTWSCAPSSRRRATATARHRHRDDRPPLRGRARAASSACTACSHFAIWDSRRSELLLARDRLGKKPLYYAQPAGGLVFGSEIKALLAHPALTPELDEEAFFHYLTFVCTPAPMTMFKGVRKLGPAERMTVRADGSTRVETLLEPVLATSARPRSAGWREPELEERLLALLRESIGSG